MMHLPIHLVEQAKLTGLVQYFWMNSIERYLRTLKSFVGNKACPEGSMAKGYQLKESIILLSRHLHSVDTKFNQPERNDDDMEESGEELSIFKQSSWPIGSVKSRYIGEPELEHMAELGADRNAEKDMPKNFLIGLETEYTNCSGRLVNKELYSLAGGPCREDVSFKGYIIKGCIFHTRDCEKQRKTHNIGIFVKGRDDDRHEEPGIHFYGALNEIVEVWYAGRFRFLIFKCEWHDVTERGCKKEKYGFTCVNVDRSAWPDITFSDSKTRRTGFLFEG